MAFVYTKNDDKSLTVNDPIHGKIIVPYPFSEIVLTKEMQRLSGITQNGLSLLEFKNLAQNDRLSHSVGAFYVMSLFLKRLEEILKKFNIELSQDDKEVALCAMLLHDIGHGPFSHTFETLTHYPHEKRTTDILLGDTEVNSVIIKFFGEQKLKRIASFIAEINDTVELVKDNFTKLIKNLVSHQLDADRIDYLIRDSYYLDIAPAICLKQIISNINVVVNSNQEYELLIELKGLASIENVLIRRYQMFRDVYLSAISVLGDHIFEKIVERCTKFDNFNSLPVKEHFRKLINNPESFSLTDFLEITEEDFFESFAVLAASEDPILSYLCDFNIADYILINNDIPLDKIKNRLKGIFGDINLDDALSIISIKVKVQLYKEEQKLNIQNGNRIMDLTDCTNLIRPHSVLEDRFVFFNPELLRIELGVSKEEFKKYDSEVRKMIEELNKKPEEFELKYIIGDNLKDDNLLDKIISAFIENGFKVVKSSEGQDSSVVEKLNNDEYYDTYDLNLYQKGGSLRIRNATKNGKEVLKGTYKVPLEKGEVYSSRNEFEDNLADAEFETLRKKILELGAEVNFDDIIKYPVLNSRTKRLDVMLEKNGVRVCLSFDNSIYTNHVLDETSTTDSMIEIEAKGELNNRIILNEIHEFMVVNFPELTINKQSKYERGIDSTIEAYSRIQKKENRDENHPFKSINKMLQKLNRN